MSTAGTPHSAEIEATRQAAILAVHDLEAHEVDPSVDAVLGVVYRPGVSGSEVSS